jgi:hypothetical protein
MPPCLSRAKDKEGDRGRGAEEAGKTLRTQDVAQYRKCGHHQPAGQKLERVIHFRALSSLHLL